MASYQKQVELVKKSGGEVIPDPKPAPTMKIVLAQPIAGHRTVRVSEERRTFRRIEDQSVFDEIIPEHVRIVGEFAHGKDDELDWPKEEAERMIAKGIAKKCVVAVR